MSKKIPFRINRKAKVVYEVDIDDSVEHIPITPDVKKLILEQATDDDERQILQDAIDRVNRNGNGNHD